MFQRTIPGFEPSEESHAVALTVLGELIDRVSTPPASPIPPTSRSSAALISGLAAEQTANDPGGRLFADQTRRGIRTLVSAALAGTG